MFNLPKERASTDIYVGLSDVFEREITETDVLQFASVSGDFNPLHIDKQYAAKTKYKNRIVHGAFQVAMASEWVGMYLPGLRVLLSAINGKFIAPLYYPCKVKVSGKMVSWDSIHHTGCAKITIIDLQSSIPTAEILMYVSLHEMSNGAIDNDHKENSESIAADTFTGKKIILLTGASGGIGRELAIKLSDKFDVICQGRDYERLKQLPVKDGIIKVKSELDDNFYSLVSAHLKDNKLYSVIHTAWPGVPKGGLMNLDKQIITDQLNFGSIKIINLAKLLSDKVEDEGGRFIAIGSTAARLEVATTTPAYSLGKSVVEDTVRLLAPELGRKRITINILSPSLIPVGMNSQTQELILKKASAQVPMGRLCTTDDVISTVEFLLSDNASFISGQVVSLTGGKK